jgi:hypothetical protein
MHGISISIPSLLTADPNFSGHVFLDGIKKSWLYRNEPFLAAEPGPTHHALPSDRQYYQNHKRFWLCDRPPPEQKRYRRSFHIPDKTLFVCTNRSNNQIAFLSRSERITIQTNETMIQHSLKPEITGTRTGYVIRFTCPVCHTENAMVSKTPKDHSRETRDGTCERCRNRITIVTPGASLVPALSYVQSYFECKKLQ